MGCQSSKALGDGTGMYGDGGGSGKVTGSKMCVYKQDPSVGEVGTRVTWVPCDVREGPANDDVQTMGMTKAFAASENGDLLFSAEDNADAFDAVHTFAVVQQVLMIYRRALRRTKLGKSLNWQWGNKAPLSVLPHAGDMQEAYYNRDYKTLAFFSYEDGDNMRYTCRSWDVVAHETGHAVLDSLKPGWLKSSSVQTAAIHEAFGDITAIFTLLDQLDMCEHLITECKGDLHNRNVLTQMAEEFGSDIGRKFGLRNANAELTIKDASAEANELSTVLTSALYDIMVGMFDASRDLNKYSPAESLFRVGKKLSSTLLLAIMACPENPTIKDLAEKMIAVEPTAVFKAIMKEEFGRRHILDKDGKPKEYEGDIAANSCATMKAVTSEELANKLIEALKVYLPEPEEEKKEEEKAEEPKANGETAKEKEGEAAEEEEIKAEEAEKVKEAPKADPEQMVNGNGSASSPEDENAANKVEKASDKKVEEVKDKKSVGKGEEIKKEEIKKEEKPAENGEVNREVNAKKEEAVAAPEAVKVEEK